MDVVGVERMVPHTAGKKESTSGAITHGHDSLVWTSASLPLRFPPRVSV